MQLGRENTCIIVFLKVDSLFTKENMREILQESIVVWWKVLQIDTRVQELARGNCNSKLSTFQFNFTTRT